MSTIWYTFRSPLIELSPTENSKIQGLFKALDWFFNSFQHRFNFQWLKPSIFKHFSSLCKPKTSPNVSKIFDGIKQSKCPRFYSKIMWSLLGVTFYELNHHPNKSINFLNRRCISFKKSGRLNNKMKKISRRKKNTLQWFWDTMYSKLCVKQPLSKKTKSWVSRPIMA